jgi:hypothetical protein
MAQEKNADANPPIARGHVIARPETQTASGAPADKAHQDVGDGTLTGDPRRLEPGGTCRDC